MNFFNQAPIFLLGCFIYFTLENRKVTSPILLISIIILWIVAAWLLENTLAIRHVFFLGVYLVIGIFVWIVIAKKLTFQSLELLGRYSYAIYLSHFFVIDLVSIIINKLDLAGVTSFIIGFLLVILGSYGISKLSYLYFEMPIHNITKKLIIK